jgi:hypothetical protein
MPPPAECWPAGSAGPLGSAGVVSPARRDSVRSEPHHRGSNPCSPPFSPSSAVPSPFVASLAALTYWRQQRQEPPIVVCHEDAKRSIKRDEATRSFWVTSVYLTIESAVSAFDIRFSGSIWTASTSTGNTIRSTTTTEASWSSLGLHAGYLPGDGVIDVYIQTGWLGTWDSRAIRMTAANTGRLPGASRRLVVHLQPVRAR